MSLRFIWAMIWWALFVFVLYVILLRIPMLITDGMNDACPELNLPNKEINIKKVNAGDAEVEEDEDGDVEAGEDEDGNVKIQELKVGEESNGVIFKTKSRCNDTGIHMQAGERYLVSIDTKNSVQWKDASIHSSPEGFDNHMTNYHPLMILALPMRRHLKDAWFVVMGKIGRHGTTFRVGEKKGEKKKVTATETGRLYLYVNDAIPPFCIGGCKVFYANNHGTGQVTVERLAE